REATARGEGARLASEQALRDYERNEKANLISQAALDGLRLARDTKLSELESARLALERSQAESKASDTALEKARIVVRTRELELSYMRITAPFGGVIAERNVKVGDAVGAGAPAFVLTDALNLRAVLHRPQKELELFARAQAAKSDGRAAGLEIRAVAEALPGVTFKGAIQRVSPSIEASSGSFRVTVRLESSATEAPEKKLLPGMLVRVEVVTDRHPNALAVPKRALRREGENDILFVVRDGKARRVEVEEGYGEDLLVEVVTKHGTLAAGEQVIVVGNRELEEGGEVEFEAPVEKAASPKPSETAVAPDASPKAEKAEGASEKKEGATAPPPEAAPATSAPKQG
ncbi:MAG: efflux RND transporter periplasmic adaptor subunit, partial [Planctomycetes bacterium]|nr:efflux RND transporter periplasmic adaptor subunit [Planctomycetota bacterium]